MFSLIRFFFRGQLTRSCLCCWHYRREASYQVQQGRRGSFFLHWGCALSTDSLLLAAPKSALKRPPLIFDRESYRRCDNKTSRSSRWEGFEKLVSKRSSVWFTRPNKIFSTQDTGFTAGHSRKNTYVYKSNALRKTSAAASTLQNQHKRYWWNNS